MSPIGGPEDLAPTRRLDLDWLRRGPVGTLTACQAADEIETRDRVIARLLDGYEPHPTKQGWWRPGSPERPEMSDGEAAIIRQHQERIIEANR